MVLNPAILSCKSVHILHFGSESRIPTKPFKVPVFKTSSIFKYQTSYDSSVLGPSASRIALRQFGCRFFRVSAGTGGGSGGGCSGGSGDGNSGDGDGCGDGEKKWSLISW
ncbi:hypothetical protein POM88_038053 [Heracleum sosnowskyi]|uniref:Uncharacterized protein n=1 Tax=Heracleum sosnowskyi TaxID=360622 RepID=A0AAD8HRN6_9APIA|nr:hypothetical protein POM88_038053 [Heracleum sosnowskyi]